MATPSGDEAALREAIGGWQRTRHPRFATIAGLATARALRASPRPVIGEGGTAKARAAWDALCAAGDPLDLPRLFATFAGARSTEAIERLARLAARNQPGVVTGVLSLLEAPPYRTSTPFFRTAVALLADVRDPRAKPALEALAARYPEILDTAMGDTVVSLLLRTAKKLDATLPTLNATDEALATRLEAQFTDELDAATHHATMHRAARQNDDALLDAVYAALDDDLPRLVYADALLERGDVRGEFIHLQIERARGNATPAAVARERALHSSLKTRVAMGQPLSAGGDVSFARGFVDQLFVKRAEPLLVPALRTVRVIDGLNGIARKNAIALLESEHATALREVRTLSRPVFEALDRPFPFTTVSFGCAVTASELEVFPSVTRLDFWGPDPLTAPLPARIRTLKLRCKIGPEVLASVTELEHLEFDFHSPEHARLVAQLRQLPRLKSLRTLLMPDVAALHGLSLEAFKIAHGDRGPTVGAALAALPRLNDLSLGNKPTLALFAELVAARAESERLDRVENRQVRIDHPWKPDGTLTMWCGVVDDDALVALLTSELAQLPRELVTRVRLATHGLEDTSEPLPPSPAFVEHLRADFPALEFVVDWS